MQPEQRSRCRAEAPATTVNGITNQGIVIENVKRKESN